MMKKYSYTSYEDSKYGNYKNFENLKGASFGRRKRQFPPYSNWTKDINKVHDKKKTEAYKGTYAKKKKEASDFRYGNYHQYYGYRNQGSIDSRILCMKKEWFKSKDVLDIGCNAGHFTLALARDFSPSSIIGIDIDDALVKMAMRNIRHYILPENILDEDFPISLVLSYGPVAQAIDPKGRYPAGNFPFNVQFIQGNYILSSSDHPYISEEEPYFDTILCLSVTKWIHLNWGDDGIKRLFNRIYAHLRPAGKLILEAQAFSSYAKKKKITEEIFEHYKSIKLKPEMFNEYLVNEVGFKSCELIDTPAHSSQGFSRPIYLFTKGDDGNIQKVPKHVFYYSSDSPCDDSDVEQLTD
ncbi:7SK snRNA methylphosphate capping enzyme-like [Stegodyphus dumicola]|uniref:7SK snRNA methylphosphate capping enzyme-like n=1 Tax=Stegodyphus dumicola TaxID=202533 RepID=UPI0015AF1DD1|nr:7SK snRNA methylphosphate capping enzyme-like [Stegodyphus dumicola]